MGSTIMLGDSEIVRIAKIVYEVKRKFSEGIGDFSNGVWDEMEDYLKLNTIDSVRNLANGEIDDLYKIPHPRMFPIENLSEEEMVKEYIEISIVRFQCKNILKKMANIGKDMK